MAVRLHFIVEGQTEETFVNRVLRPHLAKLSIWAKARRVMTSHKRGVKHRGGIRRYAQAKGDIKAWIMEDQNLDARFTTMFDLYRLPTDFPDYEDATRTSDPYQRVRTLEDALSKDISDSRFIPYFQLHEFEALLLSDPQKLDSQFYDRSGGIRRLVDVVSTFDSPELVNDGNNTAPSKRITGVIPEYEGMKAAAGPIVAEKIGLPTLRLKCEHFGEWLGRLEALK
ncbi:MAG: DUF4276 family protein [Desulfurellaceae bacterium]|nr:DUF4276 family protein [Desulfurellaceae bacterium]